MQKENDFDLFEGNSAGNTPRSLYELNNMLRKGLREIFPDSLWVQAEIAECKENASGHCYLELIEKQEGSDYLRARAKAVIWSNVWLFLKEDFIQQTGSPLQAGQKILIRVKLDFHELYGLSLNVQDIDPAYTLGEWALRRRAILLRLQEEGILELNKELLWPQLPQRVAVISSPTAAGYEDFVHQLQQNSRGFALYTCLFPAVMQGAQAESSILNALDHVLAHQELFDLVVLIRGGGATADLSCFDNYELASALAQFPLPLLSGIGHERDLSVTDIVAHTSVKTPTAAAEKLLSAFELQYGQIEDYAGDFVALGQKTLSLAQQKLQFYLERLTQLSSGQRNKGELRLQRMESGIRYACREQMQQMGHKLDRTVRTISLLTPNILSRETQRLDMLKLQLEAYSPELQLKRGFSITLHQGRVLRSALDLAPNSLIETRLQDGSILSKTIQQHP